MNKSIPLVDRKVSWVVFGGLSMFLLGQQLILVTQKFRISVPCSSANLACGFGRQCFLLPISSALNAFYRRSRSYPQALPHSHRDTDCKPDRRLRSGTRQHW